MTLVLDNERSLVLDLIRSMAIMLVVFHHFYIHFSIIPFWNPLILNGGQTGVIIFFMLSGYLISSTFDSLLNRFSTSEAIWNYTVNRVFRIFPLFWIVTLLIFICRERIRLYVLNPVEISFSELIGYLFFLNNKLDLLNPVIWTLRLECLFYVFFPIGFLCMRQIRVRFTRQVYYLLLGASTLIFLFYRLYFVGIGDKEETLMSDVFSNLEGFVLGVFIYLGFKHKVHFSLSKIVLLVVISLFLILVFIHESTIYQIRYFPYYRTFSNTLLYLFFTILVTANFKISHINKHVIASIKLVSKISYSVYVTHFNIYYSLVFPMLVYILSRDVVPIFLWGIVSVFFTLIISVISYNVIERPFMNMRRLFLIK